MKRVSVFTAAMLLTAISLCGCGQTNNNTGSNAEPSSEPIVSHNSLENVSSSVHSTVSESDPVQENLDQNKILIAYFTWAENVEKDPDVDAVASASVSLPGNVGQMASWIQAEVGGDLFSIQVNEPYSADYNECLDRAAEEKSKKLRPALKNRVENFFGI